MNCDYVLPQKGSCYFRGLGVGWGWGAWAIESLTYSVLVESRSTE